MAQTAHLMTKYWMTKAMRMAMTAKTMRRRKAHCSSVRLLLARLDSVPALDPEPVAPPLTATSFRCGERVTVGL